MGLALRDSGIVGRATCARQPPPTALVGAKTRARRASIVATSVLAPTLPVRMGVLALHSFIFVLYAKCWSHA